MHNPEYISVPGTETHLPEQACLQITTAIGALGINNASTRPQQRMSKHARVSVVAMFVFASETVTAKPRQYHAGAHTNVFDPWIMLTTQEIIRVSKYGDN